MLIQDIVGRNVFIRTVTMYYTGHVESISNGFISLSSAAWVVDTGLLSVALQTGALDSVEQMGDVLVNIDVVVDITPWNFEFPTVRK